MQVRTWKCPNMEFTNTNFKEWYNVARKKEHTTQGVDGQLHA